MLTVLFTLLGICIYLYLPGNKAPESGLVLYFLESTENSEINTNSERRLLSKDMETYSVNMIASNILPCPEYKYWHSIKMYALIYYFLVTY